MGKKKGKVLLIGWDAADWKVINPLIDAGKMPALERMINAGVMGDITTLEPALSPMLWSSIGTGMLADKHGVLGFAEPDITTGSVKPISVASRRVKAIWNILTQNGYKTNLVGWWPSHPAEPINGINVSNLYQRAPEAVDKPWPMVKGTVYPKSMAKVIKELRVHPKELTEAHILPFIPNAAKIDQEEDKRYRGLMKILADTVTIQSAATYIMDTTDWDFMGVYFDGIDHFSHGFMKYRAPQMASASNEDFEIYKDVVDGAYIFHDMMLDSMLSMIDKDTTVILISDHGFHSDHLRPGVTPTEAAGPAYEHRDYGIFCAMGPGIRKDELVYGISLLDVAPTILNIFGLPVGQDMDGKVQSQIFEVSQIIETIPSWEEVEGFSGMHPKDFLEDPMEVKAALDQLVELGYIDKPDEDNEIAQKNTIRELNYNLARVYISTERYGKAIETLEGLEKDFPNETRILLRLARSYQKEKQYDKVYELIDRTKKVSIDNHIKKIVDAKKEKLEKEKSLKKGKAVDQEDIKKEILEKIEFIEKLEKNKPKNFPSLDLVKASTLIDQGRPEDALDILKNLQIMHNLMAQKCVYIGRCYLLMRKFKDSEKEFRKALKHDSGSVGANHGLGLSLLRQKKFYDAIEVLLDTIALSYNFPISHFHLGEALFRVKEYEASVNAFNVALKLNPHIGQARKFLIQIFEKYPELAKNESLIVENEGFKIDAEIVISEQKKLIKEKAIGEILVVSGLPRSGTSMMMQMLVAGGVEPFTDEKRVADKSNPKGYYEHEEIKKLGRDITILKKVGNKVVKIISHLLVNLPARYRYKILFMIRDIDEVVQSQHIMLEENNKIKPKTYLSSLKENFKNNFKKIEDWSKRSPNVDILYISYTSVLDNPKKEAEKINSFLTQELNVVEMIRVVDKKLYRNKLEEKLKA